jgi:hypothetical protein
MAALMVASCTMGPAGEATKAMNMVKKMATPSKRESAEADEAGVSDEAGHQARHVFSPFCLLIPCLFFLFRRSPEFALGRAC